jgi:hypothetical protein
MQRTAQVVAAALVTAVAVLGMSATVAGAGRANRGNQSTGRLAAVQTARATPFERCQARVAPDNAEILHMDGGRGKSYPERDIGVNRLFPGDVLLIDADDGDEVDIDAWWAADPTSDHFSPEGISPPEAAPDDWPGPGLNKYGLVGWFTTGGRVPSFFGSAERCVMVPATVSDAFLTLAVNDPATWDNSGAWDVVIKHYFP